MNVGAIMAKEVGMSAEESPHSGTALTSITASQWRAMHGFGFVGGSAIVTGGLVAAITGPANLPDGSWVAAYLVLVVGVAQLGLGVGQALLAADLPSSRRLGWQLVVYNFANVAVVVGTLIDAVAIVVPGGALLFVALMVFSAAVRRPRGRRWHHAIYQLLVAALAVSIPIGLSLSVLRRG